MKKRFLLAVVTVAVLALVISATVFAAGEPTITVVDATGRAGETVDVTISLSNNPGIVSMLLNVGYDSDALTLTSVTDAGVFGNQSHSNNLANNPYILYWNNGSATSNYTVNGNIVTLKFTIKEDAEEKDYPITVTYDNSKDEILNVDLKTVDFAVKNGKVTVDNTIYVESVDLNKSAIALTPGDTATLIATVAPANATNKNVTWTSSNTSVATVSSTGVITAVSTGTAIITITTEDGNKTATCAVTVTVPVTGVTLSKTSLMLKPGDTETLTATVAPANATNKNITWTSSDTGIATVSSTGVITAVSTGTAIITVTTEDGNKTAKCRTFVYDENSPTITVGNARGSVGKEVDVTIALKNNPGIISMLLNVGYDSNALTLTSVTDAGVLGGQAHSDNLSLYPYILFWSNGTARSDYTVNGEIVVLTFTINEGAEEKDYPITVTYDNNDDAIFNFDFEPVDFAVINGNVKVDNTIYGDVNDDGRVSALDSAYLARYLARWSGYDNATVNTKAADVNIDTKITALDNAILSRYLARWTGYSELPCISK